MRHTGRSVVSVYKLLSTICTPLTRCASSPCLPLSSPFAPRWAISLPCDAPPAPSDCSDQIQAQPDVTPTLRARGCHRQSAAPKEASSACLEEEKRAGPVMLLSDHLQEVWKLYAKKVEWGLLGCVCVEMVHFNRWCNCNFTFKSQQASQIMEGSSKFHHKQSGDRSRFEIMTF